MSIFRKLVLWIVDHVRLTWFIVVGLILLSLFSASFLHINTNILELLPPDEPTTLAVKRLQEEDGKLGALTIGVKGESENVRQVLNQLQVEFEASEMVEFAVYEIPEEWQQRLGLLQLTVSELRDLETRLQGGLALGPAASNPLLASQLFALGPLTDKLSNSNGVLPTPGDGIYRLIVRPTGSPYDPDFAQPFWEFANQIIDNTNFDANHVDLVWLGGAYRHAVEDREVIIRDISTTSIVSFLLVLVLVAVAFKDVQALPILFFPLILGASLTWGFTALVIGEINTFTSTFTAILLGLGVDFAIHLYSRYREELTAVGDQREALALAFEGAGPPCFTAAVTSAGGFLALRFAGFVGFQQLGIVLAAGVLFCLGSVLLTLPLLVLWLDNKKSDASLLRPPFTSGVQVKYRSAKWWLMGIAMLASASWLVIPNISFEYDLSALRPNGLAYDELSAAERSVAKKSFQPLVVSVSNEADLLKVHEHATQIVEQKQTPYLQQAVSIYSILPADQNQRLDLLRTIQELNTHPNMVYLPTEIQKNLQVLKTQSLVPLTKNELPKMVQGLLGSGPNTHRLMLLPDGNMWDIRENNELAKTITQLFEDELDVDMEIAGEYLAMASLYRLISKDGLKISGVALLMVFVFSWIDMRSIRRSLSAVLILLMGMSCAGAGLYFAGVKISLVNFVGIPIVMGIGIDVIIHLLHRISEEGPGRVRFALRTTGFAAFVSAATTILSFSSLLFATNRGLHSMGKMIVVGLSIVTVVAFVMVPLGWMSTWLQRKEVPTNILEEDSQ